MKKISSSHDHGGPFILLRLAVLLLIFGGIAFFVGHQVHLKHNMFNERDLYKGNWDMKAVVRTDKRFVAISSDDFGRWSDSIPMFHDKEDMIQKKEIMINSNFWYRYATVETNEDLEKLEKMLLDLNENQPIRSQVIITPHWVVGGPDFDGMRELGCDKGLETCGTNCPGDSMSCGYRELLSVSSVSGQERFFGRQGITRAQKSLFEKGLWHPEYHGRSHFSVQKWIQLLRSDSRSQKCFEVNTVCATDAQDLRSEFTGFSDVSQLRNWIHGGVDAFTQFWGYRPAILSAPHNAWTPWLLESAKDFGFLGGSLGDNQESFLQSLKSGMALIDRRRFDTFFPGFQCEAEIESIVSQLIKNSDSEDDSIHGFSRFSRFLRLFGGQSSENSFLMLLWHAQNVMHSTYDDADYESHMHCFKNMIHALQSRVPGVVFLTSSELMQVRARGWSMEIWSDRLVFRNYRLSSVRVAIPDLHIHMQRAESWVDQKLDATYFSDTSVESVASMKVAVGSSIEIRSGLTVVVKKQETAVM